MEIYQWLLSKNDLKVSNTGYFVYCNGKTDRENFDAKLEFDIKIIPYTGEDLWVEDVVINAFRCLNDNKLPQGSPDCDFCRYRNAAKELEE